MPSIPSKPIATLIVAVVFLGAAQAAAPDAAAGARISTPCAACHGSDGISLDTSIPNLAGQHYPYLVQQLKAFKSGSRNSPLMNELVRSLSEEQIEDLAAYYDSQLIEVKKPSKSKK